MSFKDIVVVIVKLVVIFFELVAWKLQVSNVLVQEGLLHLLLLHFVPFQWVHLQIAHEVDFLGATVTINVKVKFCKLSKCLAFHGFA